MTECFAATPLRAGVWRDRGSSLAFLVQVVHPIPPLSLFFHDPRRDSADTLTPTDARRHAVAQPGGADPGVLSGRCRPPIAVPPVLGYNLGHLTGLTSAIAPRAGSLKFHNPSPTGFVQQGICGGWVDWQERSSHVLRRIALNSFGS